MESESRSVKFRNLIGFWLLGLCNDFGQVVMLTAAQDILTESSPTIINDTVPVNQSTSTANQTSKLVPHCNTISTGAVLLADILPTLIIKLTAPFFVHSISYRVRVAFVTLFGFGSFLIVAVSQAVWVSMLGVVCASIASGFGDVTFLCLSTFFHQDVVSTWSSGTGAAGLFGSLSYSGLLAAGMSVRNTLFLMMITPTTLALSYCFLLVKPNSLNPRTNATDSMTPLSDVEESSSRDDADLADDTTPLVTKEPTSGQALKHKLKLLVPLLPFIVPLVVVYFAEYFINQGLHETIYFDNIWLPVVQQYRWYQFIYNVGILIAQSSVNCFQIKRLWILPILQMLNVVLLLLQVFYQFLPSIWVVFVIILYEGLLGGAAVVNTFYGITQQVKEEDREYSMGAACVSDAIGVSIAGAVAIPVHNFICTL